MRTTTGSICSRLRALVSGIPPAIALGCALVAVLAFSARAAAQVVFSEIHYHPVEEAAFNTDGTPFLDLSSDVHEFVEVQNAGSASVSLTGWALAGGIRYQFPTNTTIGPGEFLVVAKNPARLATVYNLATSSVLGPYEGTLGNGGDTVRIRDAAGTTIDSVSYESNFPWAQSADTLGAADRFTGLTSSDYQYKGRSLQRVSVAWSSNDPANWLASPLSGPTPGGPQSVTRPIPKPVVVAKAAVQTVDGAKIVRANNAVTVTCTFSGTNSLSGVTLEYFIDNMNSTTETRVPVAMTDVGNRKFTASIPGQADRSIVRYRFKADRGDGAEVVSPRADDPQIAPVGASGAREAWFGYFVTPVRTSTNPIYDILVGTTALSQMNVNISQTPKRVTVANATGKPRDLPYVASTAAQWDGTQPGVFACDGEVWDMHIRYHGSIYHRAASNNSFKVQFPKHHPFNEQTSWFETGHGAEFIEAQKLNRMIGLPASKMRTVDWYFNTNAKITRSEQGEYADEMLNAYHELQQQLNPGTKKEESGELYKVVGNRDPSQNNNEGPYTRGDEAPLAANSTWSQLDRYRWTMALQNNDWKGSKPVRDLIEGMWTARGDTPSTHNFSSTTTSLERTRAWFTNNWDVETTITSMALLEWMAIWDDAAQNHFFWRRANGKWSRLGWDYDGVLATTTGGGGGPGGSYTQTIYGGEYGATTVFDGVNWWKDTFYKCFRTEYQKRLWEINNSFCDPTNLTALGFSKAATFAKSRQSVVNNLLTSFGTYTKPNRPTNLSPASGASVIGSGELTGSVYSHSQSMAHASTRWEIRTASGDYEEPVYNVLSSANKTALPIPFQQLSYGQTYYWRVTYYDSAGHPSVVSPETSFTWGAASAAAGSLVINEVLAHNRNAVANGQSYPDYVELRNNGATRLSLAGYTLTDSVTSLSKYTLPEGTTIDAAAYLLIWCDKDTNAPGLHTGFALNADGQTVVLLQASNIVDTVSFGPQAPDISIGRIINGTGGWQANTPSPGTANAAKSLGAPANLRVNEWMANPAYGDDWFEIHNTDAAPVALGGLYLSDSPASPLTTQVPPLSFIAAGGFTRFYADGSDAGANHCNFKLSNGGESIVLTASNGATPLDQVTFGAQAKDVSQGRLPDGGATIVSFSSQTASPGAPNRLPAPILINEILANAASPLEDAVELYNPTAATVDISQWWLSNDSLVPAKYQFPAGTTIAPEGYLVVYENSLASGAIPFALAHDGGELVLSATDPSSGALSGYGATAKFGASAENVSLGRISAQGLGPSSGGADYWPLQATTFGADNATSAAAFRTGTGTANAAPALGPVVIDEIMYHPPEITAGTDDTQDEYIELWNITAAKADISGWRLKGDIDLEFPSGAVIPASGRLLVVSFDPTVDTAAETAFRTKYGLKPTAVLCGPYTPKLANSTFDIELAYPSAGTTPTTAATITYINADKVAYRDIAPWPTGPDGGGSALQRVSKAAIGNTAANWTAAAPTPESFESDAGETDSVSLQVALLANGSVQITVSGPAGSNYTLQSSADLAAWSTAYTAASPGMPFSWVDTEPANHARRFFRVIRSNP